MSHPESDLTIHKKSLERLIDNSDIGLTRAIDHGLQWLGGSVRVLDARFSEPGWTGGGWGVTATVTLDHEGGEHELLIPLPWLLDDRAASDSGFGDLHARVGRFTGTYWGRFRQGADGGKGRFQQPLVSYRWRPGIHRVTSPTRSGNSYRGMVIGEFGTAWQLRLDRLTTKDTARFTEGDRARLRSLGIDPLDRDQLKGQVVVRVRNRYAPLSAADRHWFHHSSLLGGAASAELRELHGVLTDPRRLSLGEELSLDALRDLVDWLGAVQKTDRERVKHRKPLDPAGPLAPPMDARHWQARGLGDALSSAIAHAVSGVARRTSAAGEFGMDRLLLRLRTATASAVDSVTLGRKGFTTNVVSERPINTLARLETARQRTFIGFGGLETYQGRLDLRVLPATWRGTLCPLQTQESARIGMIRHAALADWDGPDPNRVAERYSDLSVAAALIPFIGHDDPTRAALGCKMLKQAVVLDHPEAPLIRTGIEALVGEVGTSRSPVSGLRGETNLARGIVRVGSEDVTIGSHTTAPTLPGDAWADPSTNDWIDKDDPLAHAPDVVIDGGQPTLAYGLNATAALLAWEGMNYEDGVVVSESFARRMSSTHLVRLAASYDPWNGADELLSSEEAKALVRAGTPILNVLGAPTRTLVMPEDGRLVPAGTEDGYSYSQRSGPGDYQQQVRVAYTATRPLKIGDKLTTRHGGKGVVTRIEPDERMPRLADGRIVDVLLNPLGVIRRLNLGTVMELASGLELVLAEGWETANPRIVPRRLGRSDRLALAERLKKLGAPGGRLPLRSASGAPIGPDGGVMAGPLYLVKLDHLAKQKGGSRDDAAASPVTFQPVKASTWVDDRRRSAPQRLGEMELWSLEAVGATRTLDDLMAVRGVGEAGLRADRTLLPAGLRASLGHLAVAGVGFVPAGESDNGTAESALSSGPFAPSPEKWLRARWQGGESASGLTDVIAAFVDRARDALAPGMRDSRVKEGKAAPGYAAVARTILELATREPDWDPDAPDHGAGSAVRYEIVLPVPVDHPWNAKVPGSLLDDWRVLPPLGRLAILPPSAFRGTTDPDRDPLVRSYRQIIQWVLIHQDLDDDHRNEQAARHIDSLRKRRRSSTASALAPQAEAAQNIDRHVRALLGSLRTAAHESESIAGRLSGKFGLLRRNGLGATAIRSGRAVLVGDPALGVEQARIPRWMAEDLGVTQTAEAGSHADVVVVNRQPTLHPYNLQALRATSWDEDAVALHPILLQAIAGDFDGDTVAVHRLMGEAARKEIWDLRRPAAALRSGASGALLAKLDQDVQLGLGLARGDLLTNAEQVAESAIGGMPMGSAEERSVALETIAGVQREGLLAANRWGPSVIDLTPPESLGPLTASAQPEAMTTPDPTRPRQRRLSAAAWTLADFIMNDAPDLFPGIATGAAGTIGSDAVRQWMLGRGTAVPPLADLPEVAVGGNYLDGILDEDYFAAAQPAIAGIAAKKLITPFAGTLTRNLVRHGYEIVITSANCHPAGEAHGIFDCLDIDGPCAAAYGSNPETGAPVEVGDPVGIRAALFIGEKSTQAALKAIHRRSGESPGAEKLQELSWILLPHLDRRGRLEGRITIPEKHAALRRRKDTLALRELQKRVVKAYTDLEPDVALTHPILLLMEEVLLDRCAEILSGVAAKHAAVLIRHRFLRHDPVTARPEGSPDGEVPVSALLPTSVWTGRLTDVVLRLGVPARWDEKERRLRTATDEFAAAERTEPAERISPAERLAATIRNSRQGSPRG